MCTKDIRFRGSFNRRGRNSVTAITMRLEDVIINESDDIVPPQELYIAAVHAVPLTSDNLWNFIECEANYEGTACKCAVCDKVDGTGSSIKVDCTSIKILTLRDGTEVFFPPMDECLSIPAISF